MPDLNSTAKWLAKMMIFLMRFFDQSLIKLYDVSFLYGDRFLRLFAATCVCLGLRFLLAQQKGFIGFSIGVLPAVDLSDELLLQLIEPCLDTV